MRRLIPLAVLLGLCALTMGIAAPAHADSIEIGLKVLENNSGENAPADFKLTISNDNLLTGTDIVFILENNHGGGEIFEVYWDTNAGATGNDFITNIVHESDWDVPVNPPNLSGGSNLTPKFKADFGSDGDKGSVKDGIDDGETGKWFFDFQSGHDFEDIKQAFEDGDLRFGFHIRSVGDDDAFSDTYITTKPVPEPGSLALLGLGLAGLALARRRRTTLKPDA